MSKASELLWATRDLLRHLDHPRRLRSNPLAQHYFSQFSEPAAVVSIKHSLERAIETLSPRRREIVRRCDLLGESHASLIRELNVSERHFYRERRLALESIGSQLSTRTPVVHSGYGWGSLEEQLDLQLSFAEGARQVGDLRRAITTLQETVEDVRVASGPEMRLRLAELYCEIGDVPSAASHLDQVRTLWRGSNFETDAVQAAVFWHSGAAESAKQTADCAIAGLRPLVARNGTPAQTRSLAVALLVRSELDVAQGRWVAGRRHAVEARDVLAHPGFSFDALKARAALAGSFAYMFEPHRMKDAAVELEAQYRTAAAAGLTLEAVLARLHACVIHRFRNEPLKSARTLEEIVAIAKRVLPSALYAVVCLELANSHILSGNTARARAILEEARLYLLAAPNLEPFVALLSATAALQDRAYERALALAAGAVDGMQKLDIVTSIGEAMRVQAEAYYALGERRIAKQLIDSALKNLERGGHPFTVARTQQSAARITGDRKHRRIARELFEALRSH